MARRLIRSSSMEQSSDLLLPFSRVIKTVPIPVERKSERNLNPAKKVVAQAPAPIAKQERPTVLAEKPRKSIFTFPSSPRVEKQRRDDYFLNACALCKKKCDFKDDVFMYGDFQAFCSKECRDDQIALDGNFDLVSLDRNQQSRFSSLTHNELWKTKINF